MTRRNRGLLVLAAVLIGIWILIRQRPGELPWNRGQAGSIFQGGHMGGGQ